MEYVVNLWYRKNPVDRIRVMVHRPQGPCQRWYEGENWRVYPRRESVESEFPELRYMCPHCFPTEGPHLREEQRAQRE